MISLVQHWTLIDSLKPPRQRLYHDIDIQRAREEVKLALAFVTATSGMGPGIGHVRRTISRTVIRSLQQRFSHTCFQKIIAPLCQSNAAVACPRMSMLFTETPELQTFKSHESPTQWVASAPRPFASAQGSLFFLMPRLEIALESGVRQSSQPAWREVACSWAMAKTFRRNGGGV